jgi:hypothetical protein
MKLDKNLLIGGAIGLVVGYTISYFVNRDKTSITFGVDGRPLRMPRRKVYKWNGQGKLYTFSKRTTAVWRETYFVGGETFSLTGNTENYQGQQYSETTITRDVMGALENVWVLTTSLILIG